MSRAIAALIALMVSACLAGLASADTVEVNLSGLVNADLTTYTGGSSYPQNGGPLTVGSINFMLATIGQNQDTGIVQSSSADSFDIPIDLSGVSSVDVLVNSTMGSCGADIGEIQFVGSSETFTYTLTEGSNVRDHYNGVYCNSAPNVSGTANFGSDRLDMQSITLPPGFSGQTLESINFVGFGLGPAGSPFLAAATLVTTDASDPAAVPEPSCVLLVCGAGAAMIWIKRRSMAAGQ